MKKLTLFFLAVFAGFTMNAQTADEIINNYFENIGGKDKFTAIKGLKSTGNMKMQGFEFPLEIVQLSDGRTYTSATFQGKELKDNVYDGSTLWGVNPLNMKAEKKDEETTNNFKLELNDFPNSFVNYKEKGYTLELLGKEEVDGTETFKIKIVKEPISVDGKKEDDIAFYYFETENFVPIAMEKEIKAGPMKGKTSFLTMSDYQEVDGLYFPFSMVASLKGGQPFQTIAINKIELNPTVEDSAFKFPETTDKK